MLRALSFSPCFGQALVVLPRLPLPVESMLSPEIMREKLKIYEKKKKIN
jgi:hypothetical protein